MDDDVASILHQAVGGGASSSAAGPAAAASDRGGGGHGVSGSGKKLAAVGRGLGAAAKVRRCRLNPSNPH
jgi:hypothetical protein